MLVKSLNNTMLISVHNHKQKPWTRRPLQARLLMQNNECHKHMMLNWHCFQQGCSSVASTMLWASSLLAGWVSTGSETSVLFSQGWVSSWRMLFKTSMRWAINEPRVCTLPAAETPHTYNDTDDDNYYYFRMSVSCTAKLMVASVCQSPAHPKSWSLGIP